MNLALISILLQVLVWIAIALWRTFLSGRKAGNYEQQIQNLKDDVQGLAASISVNNDMQNSRYHEFYQEFSRFRLKIAKELGINGSD